MNPQLTQPKYVRMSGGFPQMLIYENLARSRMREAERAAHAHRLVRRIAAARRWQRLADWATDRAVRVGPLG